MSNLISFKAKLPLLSPTKSQQTLKTINVQRSIPRIKTSSQIPLATTPNLEYYCPLPLNKSPNHRASIRTSVNNRPSVYLPSSFTKGTLQNLSFLNEHSRSSIKAHDNTDYAPSHLINPNNSNFHRFSSQNLGRLTKKALIKSENGLSIVTTPVLTPTKSKGLDKWPTFGNQPSSATEKPLTDFFAVNKKKYKIVRTSAATTKGSQSKAPEIDLIKQSVKIQGRRRSKLGLTLKEDLKEMGEINLTKKPGQPLTQEEEKQVKLLRKKVEISNIFNSRVLKGDEKKANFRQLMLEFHPDKTRHEAQFAMTIFHFLQSNKERFLGAS